MLGLGSLRCRLGWHRPRGDGRWNHGYCFTFCERCGSDMVRSAFGEWHVPTGFKVVRGTQTAIAALDAVLAARDGGTAGTGGEAFAWARPEPAAVTPPVMAVPEPSPPVPPAPAPPRPTARKPVPEARSAVAGSPFDFADFDAVDPTAGGAEPPPLSRAAP